MLVKLRLRSNNKNSLKKITKFILKTLKYLNNVKVFLRQTKQIPKSKIKFTVLKSPHVNKTAQKQFEIRYYEKSIEISSYQNIFLIFLLKQSLQKLSKDVIIKIAIIFNKINILPLHSLNVNGYRILTYSKRPFTKKYFNYLDHVGEIIFKSQSLNISVG